MELKQRKMIGTFTAEKREYQKISRAWNIAGNLNMKPSLMDKCYDTQIRAKTNYSNHTLRVKRRVDLSIKRSKCEWLRVHADAEV